ncbi:MAG: cohesin domain-containing protein [bacterium]|nr:cohesin domain-containing protein [bacterium]
MTIRRFAIVVSVFATFVFSVPAVHAAVLYTMPEMQQVDPADTVTLDVRLNSEQDTINAVQARLLYDPAALEVVEVSKAGSFLVLWTEEPKVDAKAGVITFSGGTPNGSYVVNGRLVTIVFRSKLLGSTNVLFDTGTSGVYRNDGLGTKVALTAKPATIDVALTGRSLVINSTTHPNPDAWYAKSFLQFDWNVTPEAVYAYLLTGDPTALPDTRFGASLREAMYSNIKDGAYTFILQEQLPNDTWGEPVRRRALVDTKPPEAFTPQLTRDVVPGKLALVFAATDITSSVSRYRVQEGDTVTDFAQSPYTLHDQTQHQRITVTAYDAAGNHIAATVAPSTTPVASRSFPVLPVVLGVLLVLVAGGAVVVVRRRR